MNFLTLNSPSETRTKVDIDDNNSYFLNSFVKIHGTEMLSSIELNKLTSRLRVDRERVVREYYELIILNEISGFSWSSFIIFKGGTSLRLAYGSPRFSDDLDFSLIQKINSREIFSSVRKIASKYHFEISDLWEKKNTILAEFKISDKNLPQNIRLKIEISRRILPSEHSELKVISSETCPLNVLSRVMKLEYILEEKLKALGSRTDPRDLFDIFFISQKMNRDFNNIISNVNTKRFKRREIVQTLRKYLPTNWYGIIDEIIKKIEGN